MKKKRLTYLKAYNRLINGDELKGHNGIRCGLCSYLTKTSDINAAIGFNDLMNPTDIGEVSPNNRMYWGSDSHDHLRGVFTPLRQTLLLLMAASNDEL